MFLRTPRCELESTSAEHSPTWSSRCSSGTWVTRRVASSLDDHSRAILDGRSRWLSELNLEGSTVQELIHRTTIATDTIVERHCASTGLLTTKGCRETLEIGRLRYPGETPPGGFEPDEPGQESDLVGEVGNEFGGVWIGGADAFDDVRQRGGHHGSGPA
jgi:hypothetical protein